MSEAQSSPPPTGGPTTSGGTGKAATEQGRAPGWYPNPNGPGRRYHDGTGWTDNYDPGAQLNAPSYREVLWGLSLGFGVAGGVCALTGLPLLLYVIPLAFGSAGLALAIAAILAPGEGFPWWAPLAVIAAVAGIVIGIDGYQDYADNSAWLEREINSLDDF